MDLCAVEGLMYLAPACTFWLAIGVGLLEYRCRLREHLEIVPPAHVLHAVNALARLVCRQS